mmetsp:Transcript_33066/g.69827  ORF Transcript_33066/g.69827 Transcript_33066/m.69827 type:complete len:229 (+) Transcript_33066:1-687(+)
MRTAQPGAQFPFFLLRGAGPFFLQAQAPAAEQLDRQFPRQVLAMLRELHERTTVDQVWDALVVVPLLEYCNCLWAASAPDAAPDGLAWVANEVLKLPVFSRSEEQIFTFYVEMIREVDQWLPRLLVMVPNPPQDATAVMQEHLAGVMVQFLDVWTSGLRGNACTGARLDLFVAVHHQVEVVIQQLRQALASPAQQEALSRTETNIQELCHRSRLSRLAIAGPQFRSVA